MLLELCFGLGMAGLYWWEIDKFMVNTSPLLPGFHPAGVAAMAALHAQWAIHVGLAALMAVASFIDFDDLSIPDTITVTGTLAALVIACCCSNGALPSLLIDPQNPRVEDLIAPLRFDYPQPAFAFLASHASLLVGLACYWGWCFALLPRRWRSGVGVVKAWRVMWRRIAARPEWKWVLVMGVIGAIGLATVWWHGGEPWRGLLSALTGMATGAGMIWIIRILGGTILKREAMGFGDVTLMAMIGAFLGWQPSLIVFFIAPLAGIVAGLLQLIFQRENVIPYGPYLCLGALATIVFWPPIWNYTMAIFEVPWLVPSAIAFCLPVLALMLYVVRLLRPNIAR